MPHDPHPHAIRRLLSGGQTGVDRAALDAAIALGIPHGGWCPAGRLAEDGRIPARYRLQETDSPAYALRTQRNVLDSDGTLILSHGPLSGGTELTRRLAQHYEKPCLVVDLLQPPPHATVLAWLDAHRVRDLNVAGPRESTRPGIAEVAERYLRQLLTAITRGGRTPRLDGGPGLR
ncbi:MAG: hypothetical protein A2W31_12675 [Planctomycetes bacterium RBG_16_64_10]|nr:MAG: hypothetical protein A2W31_12675 [Planctomycetes bacterium RBG_16_64_10]